MVEMIEQALEIARLMRVNSLRQQNGEISLQNDGQEANDTGRRMSLLAREMDPF